MGVLKVTLTVLEALLALNLLIFVHELGHFLAARWRGLRIDRFAVWFGKPIWKKKINGVEYALGWIPAGGYVALPQMASMELIEGKSQTETRTKTTTNYGTSVWTTTESAEGKADEAQADQLPPISALDKIIVAFAGPLFSFLLALTFAFIVWQVGKPEQVPGKDSTMIGWVQPGGPAATAGLQAGDRIISVDGHRVSQFAGPSRDSVTWHIITGESETIAVTYERDGKTNTVFAAPYHRPTKWYERKSLRQLLISGAYPAIVADVVSNSPAARAGLRPDDEVVAIDDRQIYSAQAILQVQEEMTNGAVRPVKFTVRRGMNEFSRPLQPERPIQPAGADPSFGMAFWVGATNEALSHPHPLDQINDSAGMIFATLQTVLSRKSEVGFQQLGGPVMIIHAYKTFLDSENGWRRVLWFSVVLNVNLALLNLLPFPVLDGGHILLAIVEFVRRKPVNARLLLYLQNACAMVLICFMLVIAFFDIGDWARSAHAERDMPTVFAPTAH